MEIPFSRSCTTHATTLETLAPQGVALDSRTRLVHSDGLAFLRSLPRHSVHAVVTDPPYGIKEFESADHGKLRTGKGGVWRQPPSLGGSVRAPVPRFTVLSAEERSALKTFFYELGRELARVMVPGAHLFLASNPLLSTQTFAALEDSGLEKRGEIIRLVQTLRGGDRPKGAHTEFPDVTVMPRSCWEPWGLFRTPMQGTVAETLRTWGTGALRRKSEGEPFKDVLLSAPTHKKERDLAPHPSLKPQKFLREIVRASLPLGQGIVLDPFAGSASTLAAASHLGYLSLGTERDAQYFDLAQTSFLRLRDLVPS